MTTLTLYTNPYHNCRGITLSAMLLRLHVPIDYVWNQAGLRYQEDTPGKLIIDPYFQDITEQDHCVRWNLEYYDELGHYMERVSQVLAAGHTLAMAVDIHELPYSMYFQHHHQTHTVEVVRQEQDTFIIGDHFYHYFGSIEPTALQKAITSYYTYIQPGPYGLLYAEAISVPRCYTRADLRHAIAENCAVMEGERLHDLKQASLEAKIGMEAIDAIMQKVQEVMQLDLATGEDELDEVFAALKETANSRHLFYEYLKLFGEEALANAVHEASQHWVVASHMLLRGKALGDLRAMLPRAMKRLERVQEREQRNLELLRAFLASSS